MKLKLFILLIAAVAGIIFFCFNDKEPESQKKVEDTVHSTALETVQKTLNAAQTKNSKEFKNRLDFKQTILYIINNIGSSTISVKLKLPNVAVMQR